MHIIALQTHLVSIKYWEIELWAPLKIRFFIELEMKKSDFIAALSKRAQHLMRKTAEQFTDACAHKGTSKT